MGMVIRAQASDRLAAYLGELAKVIGHADRVVPLRDYCSGLLTTEGRRSVEIILAIYKSAETGKAVQLPLKSDPVLKARGRKGK